MKKFDEITNDMEVNRRRIVDVETASGQKNKRIIFEESYYYISLVADGKEDFVIFRSHDGFLQFYGIGNKFVCEVWFDLNGRRGHSLINPDCTNTKRINFVTPFGQYTPRERDIISLQQLQKAVHEYFVNFEEINFLAKVPHDIIEMTNVQLHHGEMLIGSGMMAYQEREGKFRYTAWSGNIYVTNQRVFFRMSMTGILMVELRLPEIKGFWVSKGLFSSAVTISSKNGDNFMFTGFPAKKLQGWLQQVRIPKLT